MNYWKSILVDLVFLGALFVFSFLFNSSQSLIISLGFLGTILILVYYLAIIFVYTLCKKKVLSYLAIKSKRKNMSFFGFNLVFFLVLGGCILLAFLFVEGVVSYEFQKLYFTIVLFLLCLAGYLIIHTSQIIYLRKKKFTLLMDKKFALFVLLECILFAVLYGSYVWLYGFAGGSLFLNTFFQILFPVLIILANGYNRMIIAKSI